MPNAADYCPDTPNRDHADLDRDDKGDVCDDDRDGDSTANETDNCPNIANPNQEDIDGDGLGDVCDDDPFTGQVLAGGGCGCGHTSNNAPFTLALLLLMFAVIGLRRMS